MAASYPAISKPQRFGRASFEPVITEKPVAGGRARRTRKVKKYRFTQDLTWIFTAADFNTWALFVQDTIDYTGSFNLLTYGPDGVKEREVYLIDGSYDYFQLGDGNVRVDASVRWDQGFILSSGNFIDGGDTSSTHADVIDGGDTSSTHPDVIDGGAS